MISKQYLCFAACLQIAAKETAGVELDQIAVANHLGVALPVGFDCSGLVEQGLTNIRYETDVALCGITPVVADINRVLSATIPRLECRFESISQFQDWEFEERLATLANSGYFPIVCFDYDSLIGEAAIENRGHCAVVFRMDTPSVRCGRPVDIYDPGPKDAGFRTVDSHSLYRACRKRHGGIWSLVPVDN
jgi:hypothetical protein